MAFWWPLLILAFAYAICRLLLMLTPPNVPFIDVDASVMLDDGNQTQENSFIYERCIQTDQCTISYCLKGPPLAVKYDMAAICLQEH
ncbi:aldehyde dehydrogenase 22A1 [Quillaja saponaria]|uniref:Aldehyde dehydrogenase 22A1 n=1 Tax=Quillaja saponaria TaxID=32244 RepID=A0AAD7PH10_QUISA|nr:aldehyde dehydrogenase 22A1 [Quillaja saponaria]